jgi:hypothetical protein
MDYLPVLYGLLLYILYVVMPLIPSVIIYKMFPDTTVGATGLLGNLKINATGAFAAYIIIVVLGHFVIKRNLEFIDQLESTTWEITSKVTYV